MCLCDVFSALWQHLCFATLVEMGPRVAADGDPGQAPADDGTPLVAAEKKKRGRPRKVAAASSAPGAGVAPPRARTGDVDNGAEAGNAAHSSDEDAGVLGGDDRRDAADENVAIDTGKCKKLRPKACASTIMRQPGRASAWAVEHHLERHPDALCRDCVICAQQGKRFRVVTRCCNSSLCFNRHVCVEHFVAFHNTDLAGG